MHVERRNNMAFLEINKDGVYQYSYCGEEENITIELKENVNATVMVSFDGDTMKVQKKIVLKENSTLHLLYRNASLHFTSEEHVQVFENAKLHVGYFEVNNAVTKVKALYELLDREASVDVITTTYATKAKDYDITCLHKHASTYSNMENYAINDHDGKINIVASGNIQKGAKGSKSHQATRVLTLVEKESVKVTPLLLIDENDVEASHACGIGEMNEDHLYYLQTRGLNKRQALGLLTLSYLLPIVKVVEHNEQLKQMMEDEIQSKVGLAC